MAFLCHNLTAQSAASQVVNPDWTNSAHWTGAIAPQYNMVKSATLRHNSTVLGLDIIVNTGLTLKINFGDTLFLAGNLIVQDGAMLNCEGTIVGLDSTKRLIVNDARFIVTPTGSVHWGGAWANTSPTAQVVIHGNVSITGPFRNGAIITGVGCIDSDISNLSNNGSIFGCVLPNANCCSSPDCQMGTGCNLLLEVEYLNVIATLDENNIRVEWMAANEVSDVFIIEHSVNGYDWSEKAVVLSNETGMGSVNSYEFIDESPEAGFNYYRVKQTDTRERTYYSEVVVEKVESVGVGVSVYPNPASDFLVIDANQTALQEIEVRNLNGSVKASIPVNNKEDKVKLNISDWQSGIYMVVLHTKEASVCRKVVVQ